MKCALHCGAQDLPLTCSHIKCEEHITNKSHSSGVVREIGGLVSHIGTLLVVAFVGAVGTCVAGASIMASVPAPAPAPAPAPMVLAV